jgi:SAM-dependent methyltransferase
MRRRGSSSRPYVSSLATRRDDAADVAHGNLIEILATAPKRVLDLAAGSGASGEALKRRWPEARVTGIHANASTASAAAGKLDASLVVDLDVGDIGTCGLAPQSIDTVLFPDVLHRLRDPWRLLAALRPFLVPGAQLVANIPNMRLITLVQSLAAGDLTYTEGGAFDPRNLRFFTLLGIHALFRDTGYRISRVERDFDPSLAHLVVAPGARATINTPALQFKDLGETSLLELRTLQYRVVAHPL